MSNRYVRRIFSTMAVILTVFALLMSPAAAKEMSKETVLQGTDPTTKLSSALKEMVAEGSTEDVPVTVIATSSVDVDPYLTDWSNREILDYVVYGGTMNVSDLLDLAADPSVAHIQVFKPHEVPNPLDDAEEKGIIADPEEAFNTLQERLAERFAQKGRERLFTPAATDATSVSPTDWWGGQDVHGGDAANAAGYTGDGVMVAMVDSGVDFGHPDLYGQQAVYPAGHTYEGWPIALDPTSMRTYYYEGDVFPATDSWYANTSNYVEIATHAMTPTMIITTSFPNAYNGLSYDIAPGIGEMSQSGRVRFGIHPDPALSNYVYGHEPAVLLVDANEPYVYDTVFVDLNDDRWFNDDADFDPTGDKVATNNTDQAATKSDPIITVDDVWTTRSAYTVTATITEPVYIGSWSGGDGPRLGGTMITETTQVMTGTLIWEPDGKPDLSGGMIYFIADGETPIPGSDMLGYGAPFPAAYDPMLTDLNAEGLIPENGRLVAFMLGTDDASVSGGYHGTSCATMIGAKGIIDYPAFSGESMAGGQIQFPFADNNLQGLAPDADIIAVGNNYAVVNGMQGFYDAYDFIALGADGVADTGDEAQVANFSFGDNSIFEDGWDLESRYLTHLSENVNPTLAMAAATGNDGNGYGTIDEPASSQGTIGVGASTSYGSVQLLNWGIPSSDYIKDGDVVYFSNRGPTAMGDPGVDVMGIGFVNHTAIPVNVNSDHDGNTALSVGGGTSYAAPFVAGALADIYQAYKDKWGEWPTAQTAREILMAGADDMGYDPFSQGAGNVRADTASMIADGSASLFTSPSKWRAGDYQGTEYDSFAHIVPGDSATETFTVKNTSDAEETATLSDEIYEVTETRVYTIETNWLYEDNASILWYGHPDYFLSLNPTLTDTAVFTDPTGFLGGLYTYTVHGPDHVVNVPADSDLMRVYLNMDWQDYETSYMNGKPPNLDYSSDNNWDIAVYEWDDLNGNGWFWADPHFDIYSGPGDPDGVFNPLLGWIDVTEKGSVYNHVGYDANFADDGEGELSLVNFTVSPDNPSNYIEVKDPANRGAEGSTTDEGLVIGLSHWGGSGSQVLTVTVEFYEAADWGWLETDVTTLDVPAATADMPGEATFDATVTVPDGTEPGIYEGSILVNDRVIPVAVNVSASMDDTYYYEFGNEAEMTPYRNGEIFSANDWYGGYGNGDWRFHTFDLIDSGMLSENAILYYKNAWGECEDTDPDPAVEDWSCENSPGDINPYLYGPNYGDGFSNTDPDIFGPHGMVNLYGGGWPNYFGNYRGGTGGDWWYSTSSGGPMDEFCTMRAGGWQEGLHEFVLHTGIFGGSEPSMSFNGEVGFFSLTPEELNMAINETEGSAELTLISPWETVHIETIGLTQPETFKNQHVAAGADPKADPAPSDLFSGWVYDFTAENLDGISAQVRQGAIGWMDTDLYFLYDANGDGFFNINDNRELLASSISGSSDEGIWYMPWMGVPDGDYRIVVYGANNVDPEDTFQFDLYLMGGTTMSVAEADADGVITTTPGVPMPITLNYEVGGFGDWFGYVRVTPTDEETCGEQFLPVNLSYGIETSVEANPTDLVGPGQIIEYTLMVENHMDSSYHMDIDAAIPQHTNYVDESVSTSGDDTPWWSDAWFSGGKNAVEWGGNIASRSTLTISYQVRVDSNAPAGTEIMHEVYFGDTLMSTSNQVAHTIFLPITIKQ